MFGKTCFYNKTTLITLLLILKSPGLLSVSDFLYFGHLDPEMSCLKMPFLSHLIHSPSNFVFLLFLHPWCIYQLGFWHRGLSLDLKNHPTKDEVTSILFSSFCLLIKLFVTTQHQMFKIVCFGFQPSARSVHSLSLCSFATLCGFFCMSNLPFIYFGPSYRFSNLVFPWHFPPVSVFTKRRPELSRDVLPT